MRSPRWMTTLLRIRPIPFCLASTSMVDSPPSLEDLLSRHGLTRDELESVCPRDVRHNIAVKLVDWKMVGHCFSFPKEKLAAIDRENDTDDLRKVALLDTWSEREGKGATCLKLANVLHQRERNDLVGFLCDRILQKRVSSVREPISGAQLTAQNEKEMSRDYNVVIHTSGVESTGKAGQSLSRAGVEMVRSNEEEIRALFASLLVNVQSALKKNSNLDDVRQFLITFFDCDFSTTLDLKGLLSAVTRNGLWDYQHYSPLEKLAKSLLSNDSEIDELIRAYKAQLSGFYLTTRLIDYIDSQQLPSDDSDDESDQPTVMLTTKQFRKVKVVLQLDRKISELSLDYVQNLWRSFAAEYEIPSLTVVLDRIVSGSLMISWKVPSHLVELIIPRSKFFRRLGIILVFIDDVIVYDEKQMVAKETELLKLCYHGTADIDQFSSLLKQGVDPDIYDEDGRHPLWYASYHGRKDVVELLLQYKATADMATNDGYVETPLFASCQEGHLDTTAVLIKHGAMVNCLNKYGVTPLYRASDGGHTEVVELLLSSGADINKGEQSPLYVASLCSNIDVVKLLVHHRAEIDKPTDDENGDTPLSAACQENHIDVARFLIDNRANVNFQNKYGLTPLIDACINGHSAVVKLLIHSGAQLEIKNEEGRTALMVASWRGHLKTVMELLAVEAQVNVSGKDGLTSLMLATQNGHAEVVQVLLDAKADLNITESTAGWSALFFAVKSGYLQIIKLLISKGADIGIRDKASLTAVEISDDQDIIDELQRHSITQRETTTEGEFDEDELSISDISQGPAHVTTQEPAGNAEAPKDEEEVCDKDTLSKSQLTKERKEQVEETYQELLKIFDILEESLRREKKTRKGLPTNIIESNQQMLLDNN